MVHVLLECSDIPFDLLCVRTFVCACDLQRMPGLCNALRPAPTISNTQHVYSSSCFVCAHAQQVQMCATSVHHMASAPFFSLNIVDELSSLIRAHAQQVQTCATSVHHMASAPPFP